MGSHVFCAVSCMVLVPGSCMRHSFERQSASSDERISAFSARSSSTPDRRRSSLCSCSAGPSRLHLRHRGPARPRGSSFGAAREDHGVSLLRSVCLHLVGCGTAWARPGEVRLEGPANNLAHRQDFPHTFLHFVSSTRFQKGVLQVQNVVKRREGKGRWKARGRFIFSTLCFCLGLDGLKALLDLAHGTVKHSRHDFQRKQWFREG